MNLRKGNSEHRDPLWRGVLALWLALMLPAAAPPVSKSHALAEVDGELITSEEVERAGGAALYRLQDQIYALKRQKLSALIDERLLAREAAKRNVSVQQLLDFEVVAKVGPVTEE